MIQTTHVHRIAYALLFLLSTCASIAVKADSDTLLGAAFYAENCANCHGENAQGNSTLKSPALAGQQREYLQRQLNHFANGLRGTHADDILGKQMIPFAKLTDENSIGENVTVYLSTLPPAVPEQLKGDLNNGYKYYQSCGSCHGAQAQGNQALNAPRLSGLSADYLRRQHDYFVRGIRGAHPSDRYGRQMAMMAKTLTDDTNLNDVIAYIVSLSAQ